MLINNAGFGSMGEFSKLDLGARVEHDRPQHQSAGGTDLQVSAADARAQAGRKSSTLLDGGISASAFHATYAATKAFVLSFSEALWEENWPHGIKVMALCPGVTDTNFFEAAAATSHRRAFRKLRKKVVEVALRGWPRQKPRHLGLDEFYDGAE